MNNIDSRARDTRSAARGMEVDADPNVATGMVGDSAAGTVAAVAPIDCPREVQVVMEHGTDGTPYHTIGGSEVEDKFMENIAVVPREAAANTVEGGTQLTATDMMSDIYGHVGDDDEQMPDEHQPFAEPPTEVDLLAAQGSELGWDAAEEAEGRDTHEQSMLHRGLANDVQVDGMGDSEVAATEGRRVRRRLNVKTKPHAVGNQVTQGEDEGVDSGLLTRREAKAESIRNAAKRRKWVNDQRAAEDAAIEYVESHPGLLTVPAEVQSQSGETHSDMLDGAVFHVTRSMAHARRTGVAYCRVCAAWTRGSRARRLKNECPGWCDQRSLLRRLELDIEPCQGRIPAELKRPGARGTRMR